MSAELLAKMTAKGIVITGEGFGGEIVLSSSDVAGALARVRGIGFEILMLKYCGEMERFERLVSMLAGIISAKENRARPGSLSLDRAEAISRAIVSDSLGGDLCRTCNGTGTYRYKTCQGCQGTGKRTPSERARANALNMTRYEYAKSGKDLYNRYSAMLSEAEGSGISRLRSQLREL